MSQKSDNSDPEEISDDRPYLWFIGLLAVTALAGNAHCASVSDNSKQPNQCKDIIHTGVTAGLPLKLPSGQEYEDPSSLDRGDTAWMLIATVLGLFLAPALAHFYSTSLSESLL